MFNLKEILKEFKKDSRYKFQGNTWTYIGPAYPNMPKYAKMAYVSWLNQGARCNNKKNQDFKYYGAKKVKRIWSSLECVNFYLNELVKKSFWVSPVISRKKDLGNYEINNCRLIEASKNSSEVYVSSNSIKIRANKISNILKNSERAKKNRIKLHKNNRKSILLKSDFETMTFSSLKQGSLFLGKNPLYLSNCLSSNKPAKYKNILYKVVLV